MVAIALVVLALAVNIVSVLLGMLRLVGMGSPNVEVAETVAVILPLTGAVPQLEDIIHRLNEQSTPVGMLLVTVESEDDPAFARAHNVKAAARFPIRIVVAGLATQQAQKCRNQQAAFRGIPPETAIIVLMDGDIQPSPDWLKTLASPLVAEDFALVTGHRWQRPSGGVGSHLVTAIDRAVMLTPRLDFDFARVVWGGSLAMSRATAQAMDVAACLDRTLSDDLSIAARASALGLPVATRSALLVASPMPLDFGAAWRFARRQYQMCRIYRPWLWLIALAIIAARLAGWVAAIMLTVTAMYWWPLAILATLGLAKQILVGAVGRRVGLTDGLGTRLWQQALGIAQPLVDLFHLSVILAAGWTRTVHWGHVTYRVDRPDEIHVLERRPYSG